MSRDIFFFLFIKPRRIGGNYKTIIKKKLNCKINNSWDDKKTIMVLLRKSNLSLNQTELEDVKMLTVFLFF